MLETQNKLIRNLALKYDLVSLEELEAQDEQWKKDKQEYIDKYDSGLLKEKVTDFLSQVRKNLTAKINNIQRQEVARRQQGMTFLERKTIADEMRTIVKNFKIKMSKPIKPMSSWLEPEDVVSIERAGIETFIRNNYEKMT